MDLLKQWAICLIAAAMAATLVMTLTPRGSTNKTVRAVVGIFIVAVIGTPFVDMLNSGYVSDAFAVSDYSVGGDDMRDFLLESFCESVKTELENTASQLGISLDEINIEAELDAENCIIIHKISVETDSEYSEKSSEISDILSEKTGVNVTVNAE